MIQGTTKNSRFAGREIPAGKTGMSNIPYSNLLNLTPPKTLLPQKATAHATEAA